MEDRERPVRALLLGLDLLTAAMLVTAVALAPGHRLVAGVSAGAVAAVYALGRATVDVAGRGVDAPRGRWWPDCAWIAAVVSLLVPLLLVSPGGAWVAFPVMLLAMHVLGPVRGSMAVVVIVVLVAASGAVRLGGDVADQLGYVLGPAVGGVLAVGVALGLEAYARESAVSRRALAQLEEARERFAAAERAAAVASERSRMARDIHDTLAQSLTAVELLLRSADESLAEDPARARSLIAQARTGAADSLADARRLVADLAPRELDDRTLVAALRRVAASTAAAPGAPAITVAVAGQARALPVSVETALLRIAQSALANVVQHAAASRADVALAHGDGTITLSVTDDGRGMGDAAPTPGSGYGLTAMRDRTEALGGRMSVGASPAGGTMVTVTLPLAGAAS